MSEAYTLMHIPVRLVETVRGIAKGELVAVPRNDLEAIAGSEPWTGRAPLAERAKRMLAAAQPRRDEGNGDG